MPTVEVNIGGQTVIVPGVYPSFSVNPSLNTGPLATGPLIFIANSYGQKPYLAVNYSDANDLLNAMRGAPSNDFVNFMFSPSSELNGTSLVTLINIANSTQSTANFLSSGAVSLITATSVDYGTPSNLLEYSIASGSTGGKAITITDTFANTVMSYDNLGLPFELAYTGAVTGVTYTVASTITGKATSFSITSPNSGESVSIDLTSQAYSTVTDVINYLNGTGFYSAIGISGLGLMPSYYLDVVSAQSLPVSGTSYNYVNVTATLGEIVYWMNSQLGSPVTAVITPGQTSAANNPPVNIALAYFTGATNGANPTIANYVSGFTVALNNPAWVVFADSTNQAVRAAGMQHAITASSIVERKWRRFVTGSELNDTVTTTTSNARALNSISTTYVAPGVQTININTGLLQVYNGLHAAAAVAGMMTGNPIQTPLTNKTIFGSGTEIIYTNAQKQTLQDNGVMVLDFPSNTRIPTFLSDVTTWQNDSNPENVFNQQISCRWALGYYLVNNTQQYVGGISSPFDLGRIGNAVKKVLNALIYNGTNSIGMLTNWDVNSLKLTYDGTSQTLTISVSVVFIGQIRFIPFQVTISAFNSTVTGSQIA